MDNFQNALGNYFSVLITIVMKFTRKRKDNYMTNLSEVNYSSTVLIAMHSLDYKSEFNVCITILNMPGNE